jgi:hypothetical protein
MTLRLLGSTSGYSEIQAPAAAGSNTLTLPNGNGSSGQYLQTDGSGALSWQTLPANTNLTRGTVIDASSGSPTEIDIDLSSLPTGISRITLVLDALSTNGTSGIEVRVGTGGTPETTGYTGTVNQSNTLTTMSTGFKFDSAASAAAIRCTTMVLCNIDANRWVMSSITGRTDQNVTAYAGGRIDLGGTLDIIRITTLGGTDTFDSGRINILYEVQS